MSAFKMMAFLVVLLAVCGTLSVAAPQSREEEEDQPAALPDLMGKDNAEAHERNRRAFACTDTGNGFGNSSDTYTEFRDISMECGCGADVYRINLHYNRQYIQAIQTYIRYTNSTTQGFRFHGERSYYYSNGVYINNGERLIGVSGFADSVAVRQLTFIVQSSSGDFRLHGPYGARSITPNDRHFSVIGKINTIYGSYDNQYIRTIGFYYESQGIHNTQPEPY